jgi:hypothetical protein
MFASILCIITAKAVIGYDSLPEGQAPHCEMAVTTCIRVSDTLDLVLCVNSIAKRAPS